MSINEACGDSRLDDERLDRVFNTWWDELESGLTDLVQEVGKKGKATRQDRRPDSEILAETLEVVRSLQRTVSDPMTLFPPDYVEFAVGRTWSAGDKIPRRILHDLEHGWRLLDAAVENVGMKDDDRWTDQLQAGHAEMSRPVEYLLRDLRLDLHPRRPRRKPPRD